MFRLKIDFADQVAFASRAGRGGATKRVVPNASRDHTSGTSCTTSGNASKEDTGREKKKEGKREHRRGCERQRGEKKKLFVRGQ